MNRHQMILKKKFRLARRGIHELRLSVPQARHIRETARNLAEFEREELFRLYPGAVSDEAIVRDSVAMSQYAYQVHVDGVSCGLCGVLCPENGRAVLWYLATETVGRRFRRLLLPLSRMLVSFFGMLQPGVGVYVNGFTRYNEKSLCYVKRLASLREENGFFIFEIGVRERS